MTNSERLWREYGDSDTDFPIHWDSFECGEYFDKQYIEDWIKRCMDDKPNLPDGKLFSERFMMFGIEMYKWYEKWFKQFKEKS